ncbi:hypothetical protein ACQE92_10530, partial [Ornithinimicrobium sp. Y1694]
MDVTWNPRGPRGEVVLVACGALEPEPTGASEPAQDPERAQDLEQGEVGCPVGRVRAALVGLGIGQREVELLTATAETLAALA